MQLNFLSPLKLPTNPNIFIFFETRTQYKVAGKNQIIRTLLRVSTKRPIIGYFEPKKRGIKIKKVRQNCQYLIFFNEIFIVYAAWARMGTHDPLGQSVNYCDVVMLYLSNVFFEELLYGSTRKKNKMGDLLLVEAVVGDQC